MADECNVIPLQFAQFFNDAVVVTYNDGSSLQLSSCGNQFVYLTPPNAKNTTISCKYGTVISNALNQCSVLLYITWT